MQGYDPTTYGDAIADVYDEWYPANGDTASAVAALARLAGGGPVLELGVGTGRVALGLAAAGLTVVGVDASQAMLARLASKPGAEGVQAVRADFSRLDEAGPAAAGPFSLAFVAYNTLFNLPSQEDQVRCVRQVAARLAPGGRFVVEAFVPDPERLAGPAVGVSRLDAGGVVLSVIRHDPVAQRLEGHLVSVREGGTRLFPSVLRYAWPAELDLMARLAGLDLAARWGGWEEEPFGPASARHVSVYRAP
jgi:SAM-dependent methyltransferase